jgi:hypothetical protein
MKEFNRKAGTGKTDVVYNDNMIVGGWNDCVDDRVQCDVVHGKFSLGISGFRSRSLSVTTLYHES